MTRFHILTTTDFSEAANLGIRAAGELAWRLDARLTLLHVLTDVPAIPHGAPLAPPLHDPQVPAQLASAEARLEALRALLPAHLTVAAEVVTAPKVAAAIVEQVQLLGPDLLVIASRGWNAAQGLLLGSITEQVLRHSKVPTLVMPVGATASRLVPESSAASHS